MSEEINNDEVNGEEAELVFELPEFLTDEEPVFRHSLFLDFAGVDANIWELEELGNIIIEAIDKWLIDYGNPEAYFDTSPISDLSQGLDIDIFTPTALNDAQVQELCGRLLKGLGVFFPIKLHRYLIATNHIGELEYELSDYVAFKNSLKG